MNVYFFLWVSFNFKMPRRFNLIPDSLFHCKVTSGNLRVPIRWRHNDHDGVANHQPRGCLLNRLFRRRSKKTSKLCVTGLCAGNSPGPVNSPHKGPVTWKMLPFDDGIMPCSCIVDHLCNGNLSCSAVLAPCEGDPPVSDWSPHNGSVMRSVGLSLMCYRTVRWDSSGLKRDDAHVTSL